MIELYDDINAAKPVDRLDVAKTNSIATLIKEKATIVVAKIVIRDLRVDSFMMMWLADIDEFKKVSVEFRDCVFNDAMLRWNDYRYVGCRMESTTMHFGTYINCELLGSTVMTYIVGFDRCSLDISSVVSVRKPATFKNCSFNARVVIEVDTYVGLILDSCQGTIGYGTAAGNMGRGFKTGRVGVRFTGDTAPAVIVDKWATHNHAPMEVKNDSSATAEIRVDGMDVDDVAVLTNWSGSFMVGRNKRETRLEFRKTSIYAPLLITTATPWLIAYYHMDSGVTFVSEPNGVVVVNGSKMSATIVAMLPSVSGSVGIKPIYENLMKCVGDDIAILQRVERLLKLARIR